MMGSTAAIYVNGVLDSSTGLSGTPVTSEDPVTFAYAGYHTYFPGALDEVRIYNRVLSGPEIGTLANKALWDTDGDGLPDYFEDGNGDGVGTNDTYNWQAADTNGDGLGDLQAWELSNNVLVNDPAQDYGNEQNTQFESTCAVLNGNVIVAYVDSNLGVYGLGEEPR